MKLIDQKGRLFGIINVIDLLVLLVILLIAGGAFFKLRGGDVKADSGTTDVLYTVKALNKLPFVAENLKEGDTLMYGNLFVEGKIESVWFEDATYAVPSDDGTLVAAKDPINKDIYITIRAKLNMNASVPKLANQEIRVGSAHSIKTSDTEVAGYIQEIRLP